MKLKILSICVQILELIKIKNSIAHENSMLLDGWMGGWMDGWMDGRAGLRIAYSNQKFGDSQSRFFQMSKTLGIKTCYRARSFTFLYSLFTIIFFLCKHTRSFWQIWLIEFEYVFFFRLRSVFKSLSILMS